MFPNVTNRALVALIVLLAPVWFLPVVLYRAARESRIWFRYASYRLDDLLVCYHDNVCTFGTVIRETALVLKSLAVDVAYEVASETRLAAGEVRDDFGYSIVGPLLTAKKVVSTLATTGALLARVGAGRVKAAIGRFLGRTVNRGRGVFVALAIPFVIVAVAVQIAVRHVIEEAEGLGSLVADHYRVAFQVIRTGQLPN